MEPYIHPEKEDNKFEARLLTKDDYKAFAPVYNDFQNRAIEEYSFELEPLGFEDFVESVEKNLIECLVLFENSVPVAFLVYTTAISEAVELNIIHSYKMENTTERAMYLIKKFLELTKSERVDKIVCYPMLGAQKDLVGEIARFGFKFVGIAVEVVQEGFETSADALFDPRFKTIEGTKDIISKIVENIYAEFLPEATTILLYNNKPVGFCFMNLTGGRIANIPIVSIKKEHQGKGLSKYMLKKSVEKLIRMTDYGEKPITEVNTTTETNNFQALKMYRNIGFKEDYNYPQSYLPVRN